MSTEVQVLDMSALDALNTMPVAAPASSGSGFTYLKVLNKPIEAVVDVGGRKLKDVIVDVGGFELTNGEVTAYAKEAKMRIYTRRFQQQVWDPTAGDKGRTVRTVMVELQSLNDLRHRDLPDEKGTHNLGKPSGYITDDVYKSLPDHVRLVKPHAIYFGQVTLVDPVDIHGNPLDGEFTDIPAIYDVKNFPSMKSLESAFAHVKSNNPYTASQEVVLRGIRQESASGDIVWGQVEATPGAKREIAMADTSLGQEIGQYIESANKAVMDKHYEMSNQDTPFDNATMKVIDDFGMVDG